MRSSQLRVPRLSPGPACPSRLQGAPSEVNSDGWNVRVDEVRLDEERGGPWLGPPQEWRPVTGCRPAPVQACYPGCPAAGCPAAGCPAAGYPAAGYPAARGPGYSRGPADSGRFRCPAYSDDPDRVPSRNPGYQSDRPDPGSDSSGYPPSWS